MMPDVNEELFNRYLLNRVTPDEAAAVKNWLVQPASQLLVQQWMRQRWDAQDNTPAAEEPDYSALLVSLHSQLGFGQKSRYMIPQAASRWRQWAAAAAVVATVGGGGWLLYSQRTPAPQELATNYGQMRTVHLPDGSEVTLNGHSSLRYATAWKADRPREVWLDGEAYFSVQHKLNNQRFLVHTRAGFNVEVLGTKFTVYQRHEQGRVVLLSGKVRVDFDDQQRPDVILKPGELLATDNTQPSAVTHKAVRTAPYASWKEGRLVLDETTISELATRLQDTYGLEVVIETPELNQRKVTGTMPVRDLDVLLQALEETCHIKATRQSNRIVLAEKR